MSVTFCIEKGLVVKTISFQKSVPCHLLCFCNIHVSKPVLYLTELVSKMTFCFLV